MDEHTQRELQFLSRWYGLVRSATIRLLQELKDEELDWQPSPLLGSSAWILANIAVTEELNIQRRLVGRRIVPEMLVKTFRSGVPVEKARKCPLQKKELERLLKHLKTATLRFLRALIFGRRTSQAPDVIRQLERIIFQENQNLGQIHHLRALRSAAAAWEGGRPPEKRPREQG